MPPIQCRVAVIASIVSLLLSINWAVYIFNWQEQRQRGREKRQTIWHPHWIFAFTIWSPSLNRPIRWTEAHRIFFGKCSSAHWRMPTWLLPKESEKIAEATTEKRIKIFVYLLVAWTAFHFAVANVNATALALPLTFVCIFYCRSDNARPAFSNVYCSFSATQIYLLAEHSVWQCCSANKRIEMIKNVIIASQLYTLKPKSFKLYHLLLWI